MSDIYKTQVTVKGVDVSDYLINWKFDDLPDEEITSGQIKMVRSVLSLPGLANLEDTSATVNIKRGLVLPTETNMFDGEVVNIIEEGSTVVLEIQDSMNNAVTSEVTKTYDKDIDPSGGKGSEIFLDLINTFTDLTADSGTVVDTGSVILIKTFICNHVSVWEKIKELCRVYNYIAYYDPTDGKAHFEPKGFVTSSITLQTGSNIKNELHWKSDSKQLINDFTALGAELLVEDEFFFNGTGAQTEFEIPFVFISVRVEVGGVLKTPGVSGSTSGTFDYTANKEQKLVIFESGSIPPSGTNNVKVIVIRSLPVPMRVTDSTSITDFNRKRRSKHILGVQTVSDAEHYAKSYLEKYKEPFESVQVLTDEDLDAGDLVQIIDTQKSKNKILYINKIERSWPARFDKVSCGDKLFRLADWQVDNAERLKRLEELTAKNTEVVVQLIQFDLDINLNPRPLKIIRVDRSQDNLFILDHPVKGLLDGSTVLATGSEVLAESVVRVIWANGKFKELFLDEEFIGAGTAIVDNGVLR